MSIFFRTAVQEDIPSILQLIEQGRSYFKANGIPQWQGPRPNKTDITQDVTSKTSYLLENNGAVLATAAMLTLPEPCYSTIHQGAWPTSGKYSTIHRVAVETSQKQLGLGTNLFRCLEHHAKNLGMPVMRVDTHRLNLPMQSLLKKCGYTYCGIVYIEDGAERFAYEKPLL